MSRHFLALLVLLPFAGCRDANQIPADGSASKHPVIPRPTQKAAAIASGESPKPDEPSSNRKSVGRVEFEPPPDWEIQNASLAAGTVMFAPEREEWQEIGFRPNMGVRQRRNPGMQLDDLEKMIRTALSQSVKALDAQLHQEIDSLEGIVLTEVDYSLERSQLEDGYACLNSVCDGVYRIEGKLLQTKTFSIALLDERHLYTASLTVPVNHEQEMAKTWEKFRNSITYRKD